MSKPVIGVIEWSSDSSAEPAVFLGGNAEQVRRAVAEYLVPLAASESINYVDDVWVAEHPAPDFGDPAAVAAWLDELREATTDAWLTLYTAAAEVGGDTYADLRV